MAVLACDAAHADTITGKKSLLGIFDVIHVKQFPTQHPISLYFKVADAEGYYTFEVRYVQAETGAVLAGAEGELIATDRLTATDMYFPFPPLNVPTAGRYEFQIWANSMFLGSTSISAVQRGV
jgi:hypothetical protein